MHAVVSIRLMPTGEPLRGRGLRGAAAPREGHRLCGPAWRSARSSRRRCRSSAAPPRQHGGGGDGRVDGVAALPQDRDGGQAGHGWEVAHIARRPYTGERPGKWKLRMRGVSGLAGWQERRAPTVTEIPAPRKRPGQDARGSRQTRLAAAAEIVQALG